MYDVTSLTVRCSLALRPSCETVLSMDGQPFACSSCHNLHCIMSITPVSYHVHVDGTVPGCCCCLCTPVTQGHKAAAAKDAQQQQEQPSAVKVAVMVRPMLTFEQQKGGSSCVIVQPPNKVRGACEQPWR